MVHQPSGGARGMASDIEIQAREILRIRQRMNDLYVKYTGQSLSDIERAMDRDTFLEADEAMKFGIVDKVFETRPENESGEAEGSGGAPDDRTQTVGIGQPCRFSLWQGVCLTYNIDPYPVRPNVGLLHRATGKTIRI
jgi:hypothetical protein